MEVMRHLPLLSTTLLLALPAAAQNAPYYGFLFNWDRPTVGAHLGGATRWNTTAETDLVRIDTDDYTDWGINATGAVAIRGFAVWIQDANFSTAESFGFVGHAEDLTNPGFPLLTPAFNIANIPMPPGMTGNTYLVGATLTATVTVPGGGDIFVGLTLPALVVGTPPFDGLFINNIGRAGSAPGVTVFDEPGPRGQVGAGIFREDYACYISGGTALYGAPGPTSLSQPAFDVRVDNGGIGGVALAETNQTSLVPSNAPLGTSDFLSGLHPDVNGLNAGRVDNVGFGVSHHTGQMPVGSVIIFALALGPSPIGPLPVVLIGADPANSGGSICLDFTTASTFVALSAPGFLANQAEAQVMLPLDAATRAVIASLPGPVDFWWQGFAIDFGNTTGFEIRASGCAVQHLK